MQSAGVRTALISAAEQVGDPTLLHEAGKPSAHPESTRFALAKAQASQVGPGSRQTYVGRWWVFVRLVDSRQWGMGCPYRLSPLFALGHLVDITLRNNRLRCVPRELLHCASLQRLDVSHNYLIVLPGDMGHLQQLATLDVSDNEVGSSNHWYRRGTLTFALCATAPPPPTFTGPLRASARTVVPQQLPCVSAIVVGGVP